MPIIAGILLSSPLILAPLAGYTDLPFRCLCREYGAGLCVSEMISSHGLLYQQKKTLKMLASNHTEKPVAFQIFGSDIEVMARAADILNEFKPDFVDINMGCPVKKVTQKGAGAALMRTPAIAEKIISEVVKNSVAPVTVKIRKGVDENNVNCLDFAKMAENTGVSAITVHGRTWSQGFSGYADWESIASVKRSVSIPVIGNGDILSHAQAIEKLKDSGCDAVMIGRGALGNPWIFGENNDNLTIEDVIGTVTRHLDLMSQHLETERVLAVIKNHIGRYFKCMQGSAKIRKSIYESRSFSELYDEIQHLPTTNVRK